MAVDSLLIGGLPIDGEQIVIACSSRSRARRCLALASRLLCSHLPCLDRITNVRGSRCASELVGFCADRFWWWPSRACCPAIPLWSRFGLGLGLTSTAYPAATSTGRVSDSSLIRFFSFPHRYVCILLHFLGSSLLPPSLLAAARTILPIAFSDSYRQGPNDPWRSGTLNWRHLRFGPGVTTPVTRPITDSDGTPRRTRADDRRNGRSAVQPIQAQGFLQCQCQEPLLARSGLSSLNLSARRGAYLIIRCPAAAQLWETPCSSLASATMQLVQLQPQLQPPPCLRLFDVRE